MDKRKCNQILLYSHDGVARFFETKVEKEDITDFGLSPRARSVSTVEVWHGTAWPSIVPLSTTYHIKYSLPDWNPLRLFIFQMKAES